MTEYLELLHRLSSFEVEFILVGGVAAVAHGSGAAHGGRGRRVSTVEGQHRQVGRRLERFVPVSARCSGRAPVPVGRRNRGPRFEFHFDDGRIGSLDLFGEITGGGRYEDLVGDSIEITLVGRKLRCLGLKRLIEVKTAAGRPKDFEAIAELRAIQEEQEDDACGE